jgi:ATP-dependent exoDNAse (exonuclease V) beta subunit
LDAPGQDRSDPLYAWVRLLRKEQTRLEKARLLYVAVTRAREQLHLLGAVTMKEGDDGRTLSAVRPGSLLELLWPRVQEEFGRSLATPHAAAIPGPRPTGLVRLSQDWSLPEPRAAVGWAGSTVLASEAVPEFEWVGETLRHVGTVVHSLLQRMAADGGCGWDAARVCDAAPQLRQMLADSGVPEAELEPALADVMQAAVNTLEDENGRWLLSDEHTEAHSEYALSTLKGGRLVTGVMDRSFVDAEGVRWIVDYKTSRHHGGDVDAFLAVERKRYAAQLEGYAALMRGCEQRRVKVALYFPLLKRFVEWEPAHGREP